jgi:hypothetical protein
MHMVRQADCVRHWAVTPAWNSWLQSFREFGIANFSTILSWSDSFDNLATRYIQLTGSETWSIEPDLLIFQMQIQDWVSASAIVSLLDLPVQLRHIRL